MKVETIQTKCFKKLIMVAEAWRVGEFDLKTDDQPAELEAIQKVLDCVSERTCWDYYQTLKTIFKIIGAMYLDDARTSQRVKKDDKWLEKYDENEEEEE